MTKPPVIWPRYVGSTEVHEERQLYLPESVVAVGAFEGVHRGHQGLIRQLAKAGRKKFASIVGH